jgi:DNA repair exonuclease SbcCD ATPase subunit
MANNDTIKISPYSKIKVYWDDRPENYSKEAKNRICNHFAKKYGVNKGNIDVIYRPVKFTESGDTIEINGATIENIMDTNYQRELMREWIKREDKKVDFDRILKLDDKINGELNLEDNSVQHNSWSIKWLMINNFLSFGEENYLPFNKLKGLNVVNSLPANQGGKTTLTIDSLKFLLHGNTTKTDKNEEIFNQYSDKNDLVVRGMIEIANEEIIIERKMKRTAKKGGGWTVTNKVNYYKLLPDGEEEMLNEEDAGKTTAKLKATIGSEKDFEMLVLATEKNLDDLIGLTTTESGKILTRLIGLEVIEMKEAIVRKMYNEFDRKKKSNEYDIITLSDDIVDHTEKIRLGNGANDNLEKELNETKETLKSLSEENDRLLNSKISIDVSITSLNPSNLEKEIETITQSGLTYKSKVEELQKKIDEIGTLNFDEDEHFRLTNKQNKTLASIHLKESEIQKLEQTIQDLIDGGICKACNRVLDDVDNTEHIETHRKSINKLRGEITDLEEVITKIKSDLLSLNDTKLLIDEKNKLELNRDRLEVEIGSLRNKIVSKKNDLKKYTLNLEAIELNRDIDSKVSLVKTKISVAGYKKDELVGKIERVKQDILNNENNIELKTKLIEQIKKEEEIERIYKVYIELVGKKGISKLVLRSVLPIINSEVQRLLEDVCDFEIEIFIDDKNDVQFLLNKDGVSKLLKSGSGFEKTAASLALRGVLGKISTLPMPNFITFDEVLGKVANENIERLKPLFDKIKNMYEIVFLITHNDIIKDWGDNILTVKKDNNVSKITLN